VDASLARSLQWLASPPLLAPAWILKKTGWIKVRQRMVVNFHSEPFQADHVNTLSQGGPWLSLTAMV
jgi:hypothetical protein